jgi:hypothetical protein
VGDVAGPIIQSENRSNFGRDLPLTSARAGASEMCNVQLLSRGVAGVISVEISEQKVLANKIL